MIVGIVGNGRFGSFLAKIVRENRKDWEVRVYSSRRKPDNKSFSSLRETCSSDLLMPAVPISAFRETLGRIKPYLREYTVVCDVCSVKVYPVLWMREVLGRKQPIIATHPMFGPDSTENGTNFKGLKLMIYNVSVKTKTKKLIADFWEDLGVEVIELTPEDHDKYAAYSINYNHFVGRIGEEIGLRPTPIDTAGFKVLYKAISYVTNDSKQLFLDMQRFNPYSEEMRSKLLASAQKIDKEIREFDLDNFYLK
jgi:prephenate dehydrogenase